MSETYRFAALGPFAVPTKTVRTRREVDFDHAQTHVMCAAESQGWQKLGVEDLSSAIGCYVFALKPSGGAVIRPYYVGQACRQTLATRMFQNKDKPATYNSIMREYDRAKAYIYLLPLLTPGGKLAKLGTNQTLINNAEHALIGMALRVNYSLWNIKHRAAMESYSIDGTPQSERRRDTHPAASFRRMLGFSASPKSSGRAAGELEPVAQEPEDVPEFPEFPDAAELQTG